MHHDDGPTEARSVQTTWLYTLGSIVFFFVILQAYVVVAGLQAWNAAQRSANVGDSWLAAALLILTLLSAAVQLRCSWFLRAGLAGGLPSARWLALLAAPAGLAWAVGLAVPGMALSAALPLWISVNIAAPLLSTRGRWSLIGVGALVTLAHPVLASQLYGHGLAVTVDSSTVLILFYVALLPIMVLTSIWWWRIVVELDRHRRAGAELAVARERLRFASDLHDVQGHHLQVIALKSELAERLLDANPDAARDNIHEVRTIAKQALEETRSLVYGYRTVTLSDELQNAREVLSAAGARCELNVGGSPRDAEAQRTLALVVREATTNILRHSDATHAWIRLAPVDSGTELIIGNDGASDAADAARGSGLAGLRERVVAIGGRLDTGIDGTTFELSAWLPESETVS